MARPVRSRRHRLFCPPPAYFLRGGGVLIIIARLFKVCSSPYDTALSTGVADLRMGFAMRPVRIQRVHAYTFFTVPLLIERTL